VEQRGEVHRVLLVGFSTHCLIYLHCYAIVLCILRADPTGLACGSID
jgi:hypothetical protein